MPHGDDELTQSSHDPRPQQQQHQPEQPPRSTRSDALSSPSMFLPEQTPSSSPGASSSSSSSAVYSQPTPPPPPPGYHYVAAQHPQQPQQLSEPHVADEFESDHRDNYDMSPLNSDGSIDEHIARRYRAHGKRRQHEDADLVPRAGCTGIGNDQLSCQPSAGQKVIQNEWFEFQWSSYNPLFNQVSNVNIYLFNGDSGDQIGFWNENKYQGSIQVQANDTFWGTAGPDIKADHNQTFPFYFVIIPSTATVHNGESSEPTFTGIQTALPNSVLATMSTGSIVSTASIYSLSSMASASEQSASIASVSTRSAFSTASTGISGSHPTGTGDTHNGGGGSSFPGWGIALITILAFFLLLAVLLGSYLIMRRIRRQREELARRNSMGSSTPMMAEGPRGGAAVIEPTSPTEMTSVGGGHNSERMFGMGAMGAAAGAGAANSSHAGGTRTGSRDGPGVGMFGDTSSMMSGSDTTGPGMLSGADAAIVADAFRQAMRKPDFSGRPVEEDESPDQVEMDETRERELINEELAKEGRDIRSVGSARDVKVFGTDAVAPSSSGR